MKRIFSYTFVTIPLRFGGKWWKSEHPTQISTISAKSTKIGKSVDLSWTTLPRTLRGKHARVQRQRETCLLWHEFLFFSFAVSWVHSYNRETEPCWLTTENPIILSDSSHNFTWSFHLKINIFRFSTFFLKIKNNKMFYQDVFPETPQ